MGIGVSLFLLAVGAILAFAVNVETEGLDLNMVGIILLIIGVVGLLLSLLALWGAFGERPARRRDRTTVVEEE